MFRRNHIVLFLLVIFLGSLPFLWASGLWSPDWSFGGFINNPIDGASYLAKMQEGWAGRWQFTLLYSAREPKGSFLFLFYIFLGHLAKLLGVSLVAMFHAARLLASLGLVLALIKFFGKLFPNQPKNADWALWLCALGSGSGWILTLASGKPGMDMLVAESYPFLSMFTNPHFPLGLALILWMSLIDVKRWKSSQGSLLALLGAVLSIVQPFGLVVALLVLAARSLIAGVFEKRWKPHELVWGGSLGGPFLVYQFWAIESDPILAAWNRQNITPSPLFGDLTLSLMPALIFAAVGIYLQIKHRQTPLWGAMCVWLVGGIAMVYLPYSLQRRFLSGIFIPATGLCAFGLEWMTAGTRMRWLAPTILFLSMLTNVFFVLVMCTGMIAPAHASGTLSVRSPGADENYLRTDVKEALLWLRDNTPEKSLVLSDTTIGLFVPAWSGRRTVYGHPFETPDAKAEEKQVNAFYGNGMSDVERADYLAERGIDYILWCSTCQPLEVDGTAVFTKGDIVVIEVQH